MAIQSETTDRCDKECQVEAEWTEKLYRTLDFANAMLEDEVTKYKS